MNRPDTPTRQPGRPQVRVGISGWRYPPWRGTFYPRGLPQREELAFAAQRLSTIEINGSFYSLQRPEYYAAWARQTPPDFVFAVKGSRFITHMKRLGDARTGLANFFASGVLALQGKLGPLLWQLPATLPFDRDVVSSFLAALPRTTTQAAHLASEHDERLAGRALTVTDADRPLRHALEVRHPDFVTAESTELLREHGVALVVADSAARWPTVDVVTADFVYVRLHGDTELYASGYGERALDSWADRARTWLHSGLDVWIYFDNDAKVRAPFDAIGLSERLGVLPVDAGGRPPPA